MIDARTGKPVGASSDVEAPTAPFDPATAGPVVLVPARPALAHEVPPAALALQRAAEAAGWAVVATYAVAGVQRVQRVKLEADAHGETSRRERKTVDVWTPGVLRSIALRCRHPCGAWVVGIWHGDAFAFGADLAALQVLGVRALASRLKAPLGTVGRTPGGNDGA